MKKTISFILALIMVAVLLVGCGKSTFVVGEHHGKRFELVESYSDCDIYVDIETGVEYAHKDGYTNFTVMLDSYGNPILYKAFDAREDKVVNP